VFSFFPVSFLKFVTGKVGSLSLKGCVGVLADFGLLEDTVMLQVGEYADAIYQMSRREVAYLHYFIKRKIKPNFSDYSRFGGRFFFRFEVATMRFWSQSSA
jgi:hypothetical protein